MLLIFKNIIIYTHLILRTNYFFYDHQQISHMLIPSKYVHFCDMNNDNKCEHCLVP